MQIELQQAFCILTQCQAILTSDGHIVVPSLSPRQFSEESEFVIFTWESDGLEYCVKCNEGDNRVVSVLGSRMKLRDTEGDLFEFHILGFLDVENMVKLTNVVNVSHFR